MLKEVKRRGIKVISNAGGVNLEACVEALKKTAEEQGVELSVAMVAGDDMMDKVMFQDYCVEYYSPSFVSPGGCCEISWCEGLGHQQRAT